MTTEALIMTHNAKKTILVTGATGHQGGATLRHLKDRGFSVRALVRDSGKPEARRLNVETAQGDMDDVASISRTLDGISGVFAVVDEKQGFETEVRQGMNLAAAAARSEADHYVYSSVGSADRNTGIMHFESKARIEEYVRNSGLRYSIIRPVFFMENFLMMEKEIGQGTFHFPLKPETRLQMIAVDDIGAFMAMPFEHPGRWAGRVVEIAGDDLSMREIADAFGRKIGRPVRYAQTPWDEFEKKMGPELTPMYKWFESDGYHVDLAAVRAERPQTLRFEHWLNAMWPASVNAA
jgi:uncharacterized protein YbjT (DUF2867 family)